MNKLPFRVPPFTSLSINYTTCDIFVLALCTKNIQGKNKHEGRFPRRFGDLVSLFSKLLEDYLTDFENSRNGLDPLPGTDRVIRLTPGTRLFSPKPGLLGARAGFAGRVLYGKKKEKKY